MSYVVMWFIERQNGAYGKTITSGSQRFFDKAAAHQARDFLGQKGADSTIIADEEAPSAARHAA